MSRIEYNKLVRDRIPEIIRESGRECGTAILNEEQYRQALHAKLIEEARELADAPEHELLTELADVREILSALITYYHIDDAELDALQQKRRIERGAFSKRTNLRWTQ